MENNIFGKRLRLYRVEHDLTQEELGAILDVSKQTISVWEKGTSSPALPSLFEIADKMQVTVNYLLGASESSETYTPVAGASHQRQFLMDKLAKATDEDVDRLAKIWELVDRENE